MTRIAMFGVVAVFLVFTVEVIADSRDASDGEIAVALPGGAAIVMVWIPPGTFMMGAPDSDSLRSVPELPQHKVSITHGFYLGKYEFTQAQWESVMGTRPWEGVQYAQEDPNNPAAMISWNDAQVLIAKLNESEGEEVYRLPTEAEWEYVCRAGTATPWSFGDDEKQLGDYAWYYDNAWNVKEEYGHMVGTKVPNPWGLYDMHGNVAEWCQDWYERDYYQASPEEDPPGPESGSQRVVRGGSFDDTTMTVRSAYRYGRAPSARYANIGVRLVRLGSEPSTISPSYWGRVKGEFRR